MLTIFTSEFELVLVLLTNETQTNMTLVILLFSFSRSFLYVLVLTIDSTHLWQWPVGVIAVLKSGTGLQFTSGNPRTHLHSEELQFPGYLNSQASAGFLATPRLFPVGMSIQSCWRSSCCLWELFCCLFWWCPAWKQMSSKTSILISSV